MKYLNANGHETSEDDNDRVIFYTHRCRYWTDDFDKLERAVLSAVGTFSDSSGSSAEIEIGMLSICPICGTQGFPMKFSKWIELVNRAEEVKSIKRYSEYVNYCKENCLALSYEHWLAGA